MKPFLILEAGHPLPPLRRHGRFGHWIRVAAGLHGRECRHVDVIGGESLPKDASAYAGVLISGSGAMVTEKHDWSERSAEWLRDAAHAGAPLFGICYGHQLLAHALGGGVDYNPQGREMGTVPIELNAQAGADPLFGGLPAQIDVQATHRQSVLQPPPKATVLGASVKDACQAFRWGESVWGVQFHPEFSTALMRSYIHARADALVSEGASPQRLLEQVRPAPQARRVLHRFVRHARRHT